MSQPAVEVADGVVPPVPRPGERWVVGAAILGRGRIFAQLRSDRRRLFPGTWDLVGGHVEPGESLLAALCREVWEETGWRVTRVTRFLGVWRWTGDDGLGVRHEADFVVEVAGDLARPELEWERHPEFGWFGPAELHRLKERRVSADQLVYQVAARALGAPELPPDAELLAAIEAADAPRRWLAGPGGFDVGRRGLPAGRPLPAAGPPVAGHASGLRYHLLGGAVVAVTSDGRAALVADTLAEALELALGVPGWWRSLAEPGGPGQARGGAEVDAGERAAGRALAGSWGIAPAEPAILRARLADARSRTTAALAAAVGGRSG